MKVQDAYAETGRSIDRSVREVVVFFATTHPFTWALFVAAKPMTAGPRTTMLLVGAFGPSLVRSCSPPTAAAGQV